MLTSSLFGVTLGLEPLEIGGFFVMSEEKFPCTAPGCTRIFKTAQQRKGHLLSHIPEETLLDLVSGKLKKEEAKVVTTENKAPLHDLSKVPLQGLSKVPEETLLNPAAEKSDKEGAKVVTENKASDQDLSKVVEKFGKTLEGIGTRLDKIDEDVCSKFPGLCAKIASIEATVLEAKREPKIEQGSAQWRAQRRADLEHILFEECPGCSPIRDELLKSKGKRLADIEAEKPKASETVKDPETSDVARPGYRYDIVRKTYVRKGS